MRKPSQSKPTRDLTRIFDTVEYPEAYPILYLANAIVLPSYDAMQRDLNLMRAEYTLLVCLSHTDDLTAQDVAHMAHRPRNTISRAVHRMVECGYITRTPDPNDARQARLHITPTGRTLQRQAAAYLKDRQDEVLGGLTSAERTALSDILKKAALHTAALDN
jgi:DNA-binding MarR family transcriptional regulator